MFPQDAVPTSPHVDPSAGRDADGAGAAVEQVAADEAFLSDMAEEFDAIEAALRRLDDGSFEVCEECGGRIAPDRLAEDPLTTRCAAHG